MSTTPSTAPRQIRSGDTAAWRITLSDYPASAGWLLAYKLVPVSGSVITISATASGDDHAINLLAATTATWAAGNYTMVSTITKAAERYTLASVPVAILQNLAIATTYDGRSFARKMLEAIEAALLGAATTDQLDMIEVQIYSRTQKRDRSVLIEQRNNYTIEVRREDAAAGIRPASGRVYVRF